MRLQLLTERLRDVRAGIVVQLEALAPDVAFRGDDRMLMDLVWELLWPHEADDWFARMLWSDDPALGLPYSWDLRQRVMIDRYRHALQVVIDFADSVQDAQLERTAQRGDGTVTLEQAFETTIDHDLRYSAMLRDDAIPQALAATPLPPLKGLAGDLTADAEARRDEAVSVMVGWAQRIGPLLETVSAARSFEGRGQRVADHVMHCSYRPVLTENVKRIVREDNPHLGTLATPQGFWDYLRPALVQHLEARAARWRSLTPDQLVRQGRFTDNSQASVIQTIEAVTARATVNLSAIAAVLR